MKKRQLKIAAAILSLSLAASCTPGAGGAGSSSEEKSSGTEESSSSSAAETETEEKTEEETTAPLKPAEPFDENGRAVAVYASPSVDGEAEELWERAGEIPLKIVGSADVKASAVAKALWDDGNLYLLMTVTDPVLNKANSNAYEQDSVEIFLDESGDHADSYGEDDLQFRINYDNETSADHGDINRLNSATKLLTDEDGNPTGYQVEAAISFLNKASVGGISGFELQVNDAGSGGNRLGTVNLFDSTSNAWSNPQVFGEITFTGKTGEESVVSKVRLENYIAFVKKMNLTLYANTEILDAPLAAAEKVVSDPDSAQKDVDRALENLMEATNNLNDGSGFTPPGKLLPSSDMPDPFLMADGTAVTDPEKWPDRKEEIRNLYQYYMYGVWRDNSDEELTYTLDGSSLTMNITRKSTGATTTVKATVTLPTTPAPEGGYPVLVGMHSGISESTAAAHGIAVITMDGMSYPVASDDKKHVGAFYDLYPYGKSWKEQTGVLMAWGWGCSKVLDALENGADRDLNINRENSVITGVSRWGKAAAVTGAFEPRFKVVMPSCSGAGGLALFRYTSKGKTYDFSSKGGPSSYTYSDNEPLSSLQSSQEAGWFNDNFLKISSSAAMPFDQYDLASLIADEDRYLYIIGSCVSEDWVNAPSMWNCYLGAKEIYSFLGLEDHVVINIHREGHAVISEDIDYLNAFLQDRIYHTPVDGVDLNDLNTSVFDLEANRDPAWDSFSDHWTNHK